MTKKNLGFGIFFILLALSCMPLAVKLGMGSNEQGVPLEGFVPGILCIAILLCGILLVMQALREKSGRVSADKISKAPADIAAMNDEDRKHNLPLLLCTIGGMIALLLVWKFVNFYVAVALFSVAVNKFVFKMTWLYTAIFTVIIIAALYFGFGRGFQVRFNAV